ncbi:MAG: DUF6265 family protein [Vicinamibacteria bacterium]
MEAKPRASVSFVWRYFNPDLTGWEEKDKTIDFPLVSRSDGAMHFEGMSFHPRGKQSDRLPGDPREGRRSRGDLLVSPSPVRLPSAGFAIGYWHMPY